MRRRISILLVSVCALALLGCLGVFAVMAWSAVVSWGNPTVEQPIQYNHNVHVEKFNIACVQCHPGAEKGARATIPNIENCGQICHRTDVPPITDGPEEKKLRTYLAEGKQIPWVKVYRVESHIYFSHARHTVLAQIGCEACHGKVEKMTGPVTRQAVPITMDRCMECHEQHGVDNDCLTCHR